MRRTWKPGPSYSRSIPPGPFGTGRQVAVVIANPTGNSEQPDLATTLAQSVGRNPPQTESLGDLMSSLCEVRAALAPLQEPSAFEDRRHCPFDPRHPCR